MRLWEVEEKKLLFFLGINPPLFSPTCPWILSHIEDFRQAGRNGLVPLGQGPGGVEDSLSKHFDSHSCLSMGDILGDRFWRSSKKGRTTIEFGLFVCA